jgi:hypothetical protein
LILSGCFKTTPAIVTDPKMSHAFCLLYVAQLPNPYPVYKYSEDHFSGGKQSKSLYPSANYVEYEAIAFADGANT